MGEEGENGDCRNGGEESERGERGSEEEGDGGKDEEREIDEDMLVKRVGAVERKVRRGEVVKEGGEWGWWRIDKREGRVWAVK